MKNIEYVFFLSSSMKNRLRVQADKDKNKIVGFVVQYEAKIVNKWHTIVRYDTKHGFFHRDLIHSDGSTDKEPLSMGNYNLSMTFATNDIKQNWQKYRQRFEEELYGRN